LRYLHAQGVLAWLDDPAVDWALVPAAFALPAPNLCLGQLPPAVIGIYLRVWPGAGFAGAPAAILALNAAVPACPPGLLAPLTAAAFTTLNDVPLMLRTWRWYAEHDRWIWRAIGAAPGRTSRAQMDTQWAILNFPEAALTRANNMKFFMDGSLIALSSVPADKFRLVSSRSFLTGAAVAAGGIRTNQSPQRGGGTVVKQYLRAQSDPLPGGGATTPIFGLHIPAVGGVANPVTDDAGHLRANSLGGALDPFNLIPFKQPMNRGQQAHAALHTTAGERNHCGRRAHWYCRLCVSVCVYVRVCVSADEMRGFEHATARFLTECPQLLVYVSQVHLEAGRHIATWRIHGER